MKPTSAVFKHTYEFAGDQWSQRLNHPKALATERNPGSSSCFSAAPGILGVGKNRRTGLNRVPWFRFADRSGQKARGFGGPGGHTGSPGAQESGTALGSLGVGHRSPGHGVARSVAVGSTDPPGEDGETLDLQGPEGPVLPNRYGGSGSLAAWDPQRSGEPRSFETQAMQPVSSTVDLRNPGPHSTRSMIKYNSPTQKSLRNLDLPIYGLGLFWASQNQPLTHIEADLPPGDSTHSLAHSEASFGDEAHEGPVSVRDEGDVQRRGRRPDLVPLHCWRKTFGIAAFRESAGRTQ